MAEKFLTPENTKKLLETIESLKRAFNLKDTSVEYTQACKDIESVVRCLLTESTQGEHRIDWGKRGERIISRALSYLKYESPTLAEHVKEGIIGEMAELLRIIRSLTESTQGEAPEKCPNCGGSGVCVAYEGYQEMTSHRADCVKCSGTGKLSPPPSEARSKEEIQTIKSPEDIVAGDMRFDIHSDPGRWALWNNLIKPAMETYANQFKK